MNTYESLLQAVLHALPGEDSRILRLVMADFLEERGDTKAQGWRDFVDKEPHYCSQHFWWYLEGDYWERLFPEAGLSATQMKLLPPDIDDETIDANKQGPRFCWTHRHEALVAGLKALGAIS